jgi:hypothetical protein
MGRENLWMDFKGRADGKLSTGFGATRGKQSPAKNNYKILNNNAKMTYFLSVASPINC